jgi:hypothetical protein
MTGIGGVGRASRSSINPGIAVTYGPDPRCASV